ncbi:hypothetical protein AN641_08100 [Candidatus Epulonipiscioides gigas]|nr:hypothetical protein AN641_08100 [Epulopiscium sp. SCG-C07WGA-EpuloA2]
MCEEGRFWGHMRGFGKKGKTKESKRGRIKNLGSKCVCTHDCTRKMFVDGHEKLKKCIKHNLNLKMRDR